MASEISVLPASATPLFMELGNAWRYSPLSMAVHLTKGKFRRLKHLEFLDHYLVKLYREPGSRQLVCMPPRYGKSKLSSEWFPLWLLEQDPTLRILLASYSKQLAIKFGRSVRDAAREHERELSFRVRPNAKAMEYWETTEGGYMYSVGFDGSITGYGADIVIIDDPVKNRADALSAAKRDSTWGTYDSAIVTRLERTKVGSMMGIQTRWHRDDWMGRCLTADKEGTGEGWSLASLPALAKKDDPLGREEGETLCPFIMTQVDTEKRKATALPSTWAALYQQDPQEGGDGIFPDELGAWPSWRAGSLPAFEEVILSVDASFDKTDGSDNVCGLVLGIYRGRIYVLDEYCKQSSITDTLAMVANMTNKWPRIEGVLMEVKANGPAIADLLENDPEFHIGVIRYRPIGSKYARAVAASAYVHRQKVLLPPAAGAAWYTGFVDDFVEEVGGFPIAPKDDRVDALGQACLTFLSSEIITEEGFMGSDLFQADHINPLLN